MDIRNWAMDRIMQLPDCCFGRRWPVTVSVKAYGAQTRWDISEVSYPDKGVLWEVNVLPYYVTSVSCNMRLALGDQLPTSTAMMDALEPLIMGFGTQGPSPRTIGVYQFQPFHLSRLKMPISFQGRRLVAEGTAISEKYSSFHVMTVVSSIPTEVPDWLSSGNLRSP